MFVRKMLLRWCGGPLCASFRVNITALLPPLRSPRALFILGASEGVARGQQDDAHSMRVRRTIESVLLTRLL
jgi:hypothetical protein